MKSNIKLLFVVAVLLLSATVAFVSCKSDELEIIQEDNEKANQGNGEEINKGYNKNSNQSDIPDLTSTYWSSGYRQYQLNGRVRTVKIMEKDAANDRYNMLEFDSKGNLVRNYRNRESSNNGWFCMLTYDTQSRLIKAVYGDKKNPEDMIFEFGYDGSHTAYIPTNFLLNDLRLHKGVTSLKMYDAKETFLDLKCTSVSGNRIIFEGTNDMFAGGGRMEVECEDNYPTLFKLKDKDLDILLYTDFGSDGMPVKITVPDDDGSIYGIFEYTTIGGFLLLTDAYDPVYSYDHNEWQYNDRGYVVYNITKTTRFFLDEQKYGEYRYSNYEYDTQGNWTKRTVESRAVGATEWKSPITEIREYTYWGDDTGIHYPRL